MDARLELLNKFLKENDILNNSIHLIETDASFRRYYRINGNNTMIMDAPYESGESVKPFILLIRFLLKWV